MHHWPPGTQPQVPLSQLLPPQQSVFAEHAEPTSLQQFVT